MNKLIIGCIFFLLISCGDDVDKTQCYDVEEIYYCNTNEKIVSPETLQGTFMEINLNNANEIGGIQIYTTSEHESTFGFSEYFRIDEISISDDGAIYGYGYVEAKKIDNSESNPLSYIICISPNGTVGISSIKSFPELSCYLVYKIKIPLNIEVDSKYPRFGSKGDLLGTKEIKSGHEVNNNSQSVKSKTSSINTLNETENIAVGTKTFLVTEMMTYEKGATYREKLIPNMKYIFSKETIKIVAPEPVPNITYEILDVTIGENSKIFTTVYKNLYVYITLLNNHKELYIKPENKDVSFLHKITEIRNQKENFYNDKSSSQVVSKTLKKQEFAKQMEEYKKDNDWGE